MRAMSYGVRDQQRSKVYDWESYNCHRGYTKANGFRGKLTEKQAQTLIKKTFDYWFRKEHSSRQLPRVTFRGGYHQAATAQLDSVINLPPWSLYEPSVVLHESAHAIQWRTRRSGLLEYDGGHGPNFCRIFIELLGHFEKHNRAELARSAKASKIKVTPALKIPRPKASTSKRKVEGIIKAISATQVD